jgi:hypothetical protein
VADTAKFSAIDFFIFRQLDKSPTMLIIFPVKYCLIFSTQPLDDDSWGTTSEDLDVWENESVVPQVGDGVFMKKGGWKTVTHVGFSVTGGYRGKQKNRRNVLISVAR